VTTQAFVQPMSGRFGGALAMRDLSLAEDQVDEIVSDLSEDFNAPIFAHLGEYRELTGRESLDALDQEEKAKYEMNVGKALEVLRRQLPYTFAMNDLDFSIFAAQITLQDEKQNRFVMQKNLYKAAVKSLRVASAISLSLSPSMNVRKIQYNEDSMTIECIVDVVLPDAIRVDGQSMWEGMFFFGLDPSGKIASHTFDRKITTRSPQQMLNTRAYPWITATPKNPVVEVPVPIFTVRDD
jgi:hypothetical protein